MAGWDEGNVFYSDQRYTADEGNTPAVAHIAERKFAEFIRTFRSEDDEFIYRDQLLRNKDRLRIKLEHIRQFNDELGDLLVNKPAEYLGLLELASARVLQSLQSLQEEGAEPPEQVVQVFLYSETPFGPKTLRELSSEHVSKLVTISGIVTAAGKPRAKATHVSLQCQNCKNTKEIVCKPGLSGVNLPRRCELQSMEGAEPCPLDPFVVLPDSSKYVDQQTLKLQESPEDIPTGELPRNILLVVDRHLVQKIVPGTRVTTVGIFSIMQAKQGKNENFAIRQPYLRVVGLEEDSEGSSRSSPTFTLEEEQNFREFASQSDCLDRVFGSIAPSIFGSPDIKRAIACLLFGGSRKRLPDGTRIRGDINVLMLGDPSTAKSQFLKFVEQVAPISVYTSGKGSSAAGLTASVIKDPSSGEFYLEGGAMVLADGGVVCIDEFDKMRMEDRVAIHEAMEQQTISIAKAGITTVLNSRAAVLAAANPPSGRYDDLKTAQENIDIQTTMLSRFDLIFIVKDEKSFNRDLEIARHIVGVHRRAGESTIMDNSDNAKDNFLKRYIEYCKHKCSPRMAESASQILQNEYVRIRQNAREQSVQTKDAPAVPITVRQLEAIVRVSESLAKMQLQLNVTESHVREAIRLFNVSTVDASNSGIVDSIVFTAEQREEFAQIEQQIKRRLAIGASLSEKRLIDDVIKYGFTEQSIRRSLVFLTQQGDIEHRRERRIIHRRR
ncbi:minichromosome maintenance protein 5 [Chloropicon primus]|uniref:DNA replication licensing factor MCM5 n=1 Tax=Chloropicon primus TaxID=1764295 RepID=A0A5B8MFL4_9CHLO|nr:minichromosome maintenance protein 5 [Chloropicon primus]UPQ97333.1 minichromosome maintenance protein 5 [Chloropicon primus]|eukprot:QDZ18120.1 minichromosome maintenance protein 5 [Chloropicon primus]